MIVRTDLQKQAEKELEQGAIRSRSTIADSSEQFKTSNVYKSLHDLGFIYITAPEEEPPQMSFLTLDSLRNYKEGKSMKPGNIRLNFRKLISAIPEIIPIGYGIANDAPILKICGALGLWKILRDVLTVEITKEQAFVMIALWNHCDSNHKIVLESGMAATNELRNRCSEPELTTHEYNRVIDDLITLECIEVTEGIIWLREWISRRYTYSI